MKKKDSKTIPLDLKMNYKNIKKKAECILNKYTLKILFSLFCLLIFLLAASIITKADELSDEVVQPVSKSVEVIDFGSQEQELTVAAKVKNLSTVTLVAQSNGPVSQLAVVEGTHVLPGYAITQQSSAYSAGSAAILQRQTAQTNVSFATRQLELVTESVVQARSQADRSRDNTEELRLLSEKAVADTKDVISLSETQLADLEAQLTDAINGGATADVVTGLRSGVIATKNGLVAARTQLRSLEYQVDTDKPPTQLADTAYDMVYTTTQLQLETVEMQKKLADLALKSAYIAEAATRVQAPFAGRIEKIFVQKGQYLTVGTPVAVLQGDSGNLCIQISITGSLASSIDQTKNLGVRLGQELIELPITHVSQTNVKGSLYEVLALVPHNLEDSFYDGQSIEVVLPIGNQPDFGKVAMMLPLDAVYMTNTDTFVYVMSEGVVEKKTVVLGEVLSEKVEIISGIEVGEQVILDRTVVAGELVTAQAR